MPEGIVGTSNSAPPPSYTTVATPCKEYRAIQDDWDLITTLLGGTRAMRNAQIKYLPQEERESGLAYQARLARSFLYNAFTKSVNRIAAKPFIKPVALGDDMPEQLQEFCENVDGRGSSLTVFAHKMFRTLVAFGACHWLVDYRPNDPGVSLAEGAGLPYWTPVHPRDLIGWKIEYADGTPILVQVRIKECVTVPVDEWNEREVHQIRVIAPDHWEIWRQTTDEQGNPNADEWQLYDTGEWTLGRISLVSVVAPNEDADEVMIGDPPLKDLAWLNVEHWQSSSDQRHILHVVRAPILLAAGFDPDDDTIVVGVNSAVKVADPTARLEYVEHTGAAVEAGQQDLQDLENRMEQLGIELVVAETGDVTATQSAIEAAGAGALLGMLMIRMQDAIENALDFTADWMGIPYDGGSVEISKAFSLPLGDSDDITQLINMRMNGEISQQTFWQELKRRSFLPDDFDPQTEQELIEGETRAQAQLQDELTPPDEMPPPTPSAAGAGAGAAA